MFGVRVTIESHKHLTFCRDPTWAMHSVFFFSSFFVGLGLGMWGLAKTNIIIHRSPFYVNVTTLICCIHTPNYTHRQDLVSYCVSSLLSPSYNYGHDSNNIKKNWWLLGAIKAKNAMICLLIIDISSLFFGLVSKSS